MTSTAPTTEMDDPLQPVLAAESLRKYYSVGRALGGWRRSVVHAVDDVDLSVHAGETVALVGESGSGKSTLARLLLRLEPPTAGRLLYKGTDVTEAHKKTDYRSAVQAVFQDPASSLDPRRTVGYSITEPLKTIHNATQAEQRQRLDELLDLVGLKSSMQSSYPHEMSGGMQQRIAIARALAPRPSVIVLDEPVSSLDVSIRAQVMNLLKDIQDELGVSYIVIAHDLATVRFLADRVAVMYLGRIVESGTVEDVFKHTLHPYSQQLLKASALKAPGSWFNEEEELAQVAEIGSASNLPPGCRFNPRCPWAWEACVEKEPILTEWQNGHDAACHLHDAEVEGAPVQFEAPTM